MASVGEGVRPGSVVELTEGGIGQLASFHEEDGLFEVCLTSGSTCRVPLASLRVPSDLRRPGLGGGPSSFDVLVGSRIQEDLLGDEVAACLFEKGFCVLKLCDRLGAEERKGAIDEVNDRAVKGRMHRLPEEVEQGYLGTNNKGRVAWLDASSAASPKHAALDESDAFVSTLAAMLQPHCSDMLGCFVDERTPALVSLSLPDDQEADWPPADADDQTLGDFLRTWRRSQIKIVHFMGPAVADVALELSESEAASTLPFKQDVVDIAGEPNTIVIFRTACFNYECRCAGEFLSVSATLLEHTEALELSDFDADDAHLLAATSGPPGPRGDQIVIVNQATRLMCNWDDVEAYRAGLAGSCDAGVEIPILRWDANYYYNPDDSSRTAGQTYLKHQSYVEGLELFDHKYFDILAKDAAIMDPMQRHVLEVGAQCLFKMGITKKVSNRTPHHAGCSVGLDKDDWDRQAADLFGCTGGNNVQAIISNRFSFVFNLRGPNYVADTACSASLVATHMATFALLDKEIEKLDFHVALGIHQCLLPWGFENFGPKMQWERCYTFNDTANGYMRGDGCSGITLKYGEFLKERDAVWRASRVGQNGRSATMTAPNGIAQEEVIMKAIREARIQPPESTVWNCHGTGTALGDPIEVGGVRRVMIREKRVTPLLICTNKPLTGHLEGGAAMTTIIAATLQVKAACAWGFCHLGRLNPNLEQSSFDFCLTNEVVTSGVANNNIHISSFGFGGTNGHCILSGTAHSDAMDPTSMVLQKIRKMAPPEVRVNGDDPSMWEWDGPDVTIKPGDKYRLSLELQEDASIRWTKEGEAAEADEDDDGEEDFYCITGLFNDWEAERMDDGSISGLRTISIEAPESGVLQFRFLKNGEEDQVIYPEVDMCSRKTVPILGPAKGEQNTWYVQCAAKQLIQIELFICRGRRSILWMPA
mmetsp:Transcript_125838/g.402844  ORF Transcript_125838/g.402844 Transcript_125838/m.402844 type:complete len:932 (-) Transcript_125838:47-2842(-)